ncbi:paraquat-inducible protein A [Brenneria roseae subsp. americana]|uniref:Paraquat-inducible protein A n=1 Tax=Brenneria roseae subsp. americana TaxID=1508507 RepID=A0A2U1TYD2_9GAMM|nr:paraquat-inducible protein A [Brenneria roseae]PWC14390.1 paraquat-inducible protein A [Brenneria roseae subsp. americana]
MANIPYARQINVTACHVCGLVCQHDAATDTAAVCPRCHSRLTYRHHDSLTRSAALLISAMIFYIPANVLPVMYTSMFGNGSESTIMAGVIDFWRGGSYGIALLIFTASVVIPCLKFLILAFLLLASRRQRTWAMLERAKLYRMTEWIGYWSMLDVVVIAAVSSLVRFQSFSEAEPRSGILFFGLVVILTMLSAINYDPRLIWEGDVK